MTLHRPSVALPSVVDLLADPAVFGPHFEPAASWRAWGVCLKALFGLPMDAADVEVYHRHTGRTRPPTAPAREGWLVVGRRGGKSRIAALVAVYLACFRDYARVLAPGERGVVMVLAADRRQARVILQYIAALLDATPMLATLVERRTAEALHLQNRIVIEVHTASFRSVRGYTVVAALLDEIAYWRSEESANPDTEVVAAIRPAMATVPGSLLLALSSPYARRGALWQAYRQHYGREADAVLVWLAPTLGMNPAIDPRVVADAYAQDEAAARAEYGAEFRSDIEGFLSADRLDACVDPGVVERPPVFFEEENPYLAFVDPSGGAADAMTLALAHREPDGTVLLDALRERKPPFSPEAVVEEFAALCAAYRVSTVHGDRYAGEWPREAFARYGVQYVPSDKAKSDLYQAALPLLTSGRARLLDVARLRTQLASLERRTARGGRDSIDHAPGGHDDLANAAAGALVLAAGAAREDLYTGWDDQTDPQAAEAAQAAEAEEEARRLAEAVRTRGGWFPGDPL